MSFTLPALPYAMDALEPNISKETLEYHYGKHHQAYVTNLNKLIESSPLKGSSLEELVMKADGGLYNNAAQVWNHTFYWNCLSPNGGEPTGAFADQLVRDFGSIEAFKEQFTTACATLFGSGWAFLVKDDSGSLKIVQEPNAGNPLRCDLKPVLTCDVWEHAYYVDYRNARPKYVETFWKLVNWDFAAENYQS